MQTVFYSIHNLVTLSVTGTDALLSQVHNQLRTFEVEHLINKPDIVIMPYLSANPRGSYICIDSIRAYSDGLYDDANLSFAFNIRSSQSLYYFDSLHLPLNLILQISLLKVGSTFIHAAALGIPKQANRALILAAFPGTGKTTTVCNLVRRGYSLIADDLCIISNNQVFPFPQPFSVYPYHHYLLPQSVLKKYRLTFIKSRLNHFLSHRLLPILPKIIGRAISLLANKYFPLCISIDPALIFNSYCFQAEPCSFQLVLMSRTSHCNSVIINDLPSASAKETVKLTLVDEWHSYLHHITQYNAIYCADSDFSFNAAIELSINTVFATIPDTLPSIEIPEVTSYPSFPDQLSQIISQVYSYV